AYRARGAAVGPTEPPGGPTRVPRSTGPACAGTVITSEYGAPLYGPPRYTAVGDFPACGMYSRSDPTPVPIVVDPTCDPAGQSPVAACRSGHNGTPPSFATSPGGSSVVNPEMFCSPSVRVSCKLNEDEEPPTGFVMPAFSAGVKAPVLQPWSMVKFVVWSTGGVPDHGVSSESIA